MRVLILPYSEIPIEINDENLIVRVGSIDWLSCIIEMRLSDWMIDAFNTISLWLDLFISNVGTAVPENQEEFEKYIRENWEQWCTEDVIIGNQLDHYQFGDSYKAHDMVDYYGVRSDYGDLFQRRYDFSDPDIEVRFVK